MISYKKIILMFTRVPSVITESGPRVNGSFGKSYTEG